jgi:hypothetical protein
MSECDTTRPATKPHGRCLRYSVRSFLLFMVVIGAMLAWLGKHVIRSQIQRPVVAKIQAAGGSGYYDYQTVPGHVYSTKSPPGSPIVRWILGDDIYATVNVVFLDDPRTTDDSVVELHRLPGLLDVSLSGTGVTDGCISDLLRIPRLRSLMLSGTTISPEGLNRLSHSDTLQSVHLYGTGITDGHVRQLSRFSSLK